MAEKVYLFSYPFKGGRWSFDIRAASPDEAKQRLAALAFARFDGELVARFPIGTGPLVKLYVWFRRTFANAR